MTQQSGAPQQYNQGGPRMGHSQDQQNYSGNAIGALQNAYGASQAQQQRPSPQPYRQPESRTPSSAQRPPPGMAQRPLAQPYGRPQQPQQQPAPPADGGRYANTLSAAVQPQQQKTDTPQQWGGADDPRLTASTQPEQPGQPAPERQWGGADDPRAALGGQPQPGQPAPSPEQRVQQAMSQQLRRPTAGKGGGLEGRPTAGAGGPRRRRRSYGTGEGRGRRRSTDRMVTRKY